MTDKKIVLIGKLSEEVRKRDELLSSLSDYFRTLETQLTTTLTSLKEVAALHEQLTTKMDKLGVAKSDDNTGA